MSATRRLTAILAANLILVLSALAVHAQPAPGPVGSPKRIWREQIHWIPMIDAAGYPHLLQARICRPLVDTLSRIVVIAHGTFPNNRTAVPGRCEAAATRWFLDRGFIAVLALRRGYGASAGDWAEGIYHRPCDQPDYASAGLETARDIAATVDYATALPFAQPNAAIVIGHSGGGWGAVAYNTLPHPRVTALISMAGGRGQVMTNTGPSGSVGQICWPTLRTGLDGAQRRRCSGSIAKTINFSRLRSRRRFTMRSQKMGAWLSSSGWVHLATMDIASFSGQAAPRFGGHSSPTTLPSDLHNDGRAPEFHSEQWG